MIENSDAFIALPSGFGTLEEIFHTVSWAQLNIHNKPVGLLNINNYYDSLLTFLDKAVEHNFISENSRRMLISASTADQLIDDLEAFVHKPDPMIAKINCVMPKNYRIDKPRLSIFISVRLGRYENA